MRVRHLLPLLLLTLLVGCEATDPEFPNNAPLADAGDDLEVETGTTVQLDGTASRDIDGDAITFRWTLQAKPGGSRATLNRTDVGRPHFLVDRAGTYRFALTVSDGRRTSTVDEVTVTAQLASSPVCRTFPSALDFGAVPLTGASTRSITVENIGGGVLTGALSLGPGCDGFSILGPATYTLVPYETATFTLTFEPTTAGAFACDLLVPGCDPVALSGAEGSGPNCDLQILTPDLGAVVLDDTPGTAEVVVTNTGSSGTLTGALNLSGSDEWTIVGSPSYSLGAGASRSFTLQFAPTTVGFQTVLVETGSTACSTVVEATATGLKSLIPYCEVSRTSIDFGDVNFREFPGIDVTITNLGGENLSGDFGLSDCGFDFWLEGDLDFFLLTNEQATVRVNFLPTVEGPISCELFIDNITCDPIPITANGVDPMTPECTPDAEALDFGGVTLGSSADLPLRVQNTFTGTLDGTPAIEDDPDGLFSIVQGAGAFALGADEFVDLVVRFTPQGLVTTNASLTLGPDCPPIPLIGTGGPPPFCTLSRSSVDLGTVTVGDVEDFTIRVTNDGGGTLSHTLTEDCPYLTVTGPSSFSLGAGQFVDLTFRFAPTARGNVDCSIDLGPTCGSVPVQATVNGASFAADVQPRLNDDCLGCHSTFTYNNTVPSRVNLTTPASSSLLQKPACQVFHSGGCRSGWAVGDPNYNITLQWIQQGAFNN